MTKPVSRRLHAVLWTLIPLLTALLAAASTQVRAQETLAGLHIDPDRISVSGISSGAFMASQLHIAHSELIMGVGLVAGGLYGCAAISVDAESGELAGSVSRALDRCMAARPPVAAVETFRARTAELAAGGWIDPPDGLAGDRVYLFTGRADETVSHVTVERSAQLYEALGVEPGNIALDSFREQPPGPGSEAGHSWVTEDCCQPCAVTGPPFINDCDYDQAGAILKHIYGPLAPKAANLTGETILFDQREFAPAGQAVINGLDETGVLYVPADCAAGETCRLHVVLHGCQQAREVLGDGFYSRIGMNEWADSNRIVVLYPQAHSVTRADLDAAYPGRWFRNGFAVNPKGCWNWWGYAYDDRFALKDGVQVGAILGMIERLMDNAPE